MRARTGVLSVALLVGSALSPLVTPAHAQRVLVIRDGSVDAVSFEAQLKTHGRWEASAQDVAVFLEMGKGTPAARCAGKPQLSPTPFDLVTLEIQRGAAPDPVQVAVKNTRKFFELFLFSRLDFDVEHQGLEFTEGSPVPPNVWRYSLRPKAGQVDLRLTGIIVQPATGDSQNFKSPKGGLCAEFTRTSDRRRTAP